MSKQRILNKSLEENFKGIWIPKDIWLCDELTPIQMLVLMQIDSLDGKFGCTASNAHISTFFGVHLQTISDHIQTLQKKGFINCEYQDNDKSKARTIRCTTKFKLITAGIVEELADYQEFKKLRRVKENTEGVKENTEQVITLEEHIDNNIINNIIPTFKKGNKDEIKIRKESTKLSLDEAITSLEAYKLDSVVLDAFCGFLEDCRYGKGKNKSPVSERSLRLLLKELEVLSGGSSQSQVQIITKSVVGGYLSFYGVSNFKLTTKTGYRTNDSRNNDQYAGY